MKILTLLVCEGQLKVDVISHEEDAEERKDAILRSAHNLY